MRVLVTGAVSGIGRATVNELRDRDHEILAIDRQEADFEDSRINFYQLDIYKDSLDEIIGEEDFDVLLNCAGYYDQGSIEDMPLEKVEEIFRSNVFGLLKVTRKALPTLRENQGKIINVSSVAGRISLPFSGHYCGSKHALEAISDALRMEVSDQGINVVVVEPGIIETGFNERARDALEEYLGESVYDERYGKMLRNQEMSGVKAEVPARKIADIVEEKNPKKRYQAPLRAKLLVILNGLMPGFLADYLKKRMVY